MVDISSLKEKKQSYVDQKADEIAKEMVERGWTDHKISTCDYPNWDRQLHYEMPSIAKKLREMGFNVSYSVLWGVTDWVITVNN
jgi:hypothetical protein